MDVLETPQGSFRLERWRSAPRSPLRAWDAADEYVLHHLAETDVDGSSWLLHNDAFGALACALATRSPVSIGDSWTSFAAARRNADANGLAISGDRQRSPLEAGDEPVDVALVKVPKSLANAVPPASRSLFSAPGAAWQDAHPAAAKTSAPFAASAVWFSA